MVRPRKASETRNRATAVRDGADADLRGALTRVPGPPGSILDASLRDLTIFIAKAVVNVGSGNCRLSHRHGDLIEALVLLGRLDMASIHQNSVPLGAPQVDPCGPTMDAYAAGRTR